MRSVLVVFAFIVASASAAITCLPYSVPSKDYKYTCQATVDGTCADAKIDATVYPMSVSTACECKNARKLPLSFARDSQKCIKVDDALFTKIGRLAMPGDGCATTADCAGANKCDSVLKVCLAIADGQSCTKNGECGFGSSCQTKKCAKAKLDSCLTHDDCGGDPIYMCKTAAGKKQCYKRFSQANGVTVDDAEICQSMELAGGKCAAVPEPKPSGTTCTNNEDCMVNPPAGIVSTFGSFCRCSDKAMTKGTCFAYKAAATAYLNSHKAKFACYSTNKCQSAYNRPSSCIMSKCGSVYMSNGCNKERRDLMTKGAPSSVVSDALLCAGCPASSAVTISGSTMAAVSAAALLLLTGHY